MLSKEMQKALNDQMTFELYSAYVYLAMASYMHDENLEGMASWMEAQAQEEVGHAMKFYHYLIDRRSHAEFGALDKPKPSYSSPLEAFETAFKHEQEVTKRIHNIVKLAQKENDYPTESFLTWFVDEQVEEESTTDEVVQRLRQIGDFQPGLFFYDRELGQRGGGGH